MSKSKFKSVFSLLLCALVCSCIGYGSKSGTEAIPVINFDEAVENIGDIKLSNYAGSIEYIPLETASDALLGDKISKRDSSHSYR